MLSISPSRSALALFLCLAPAPFAGGAAKDPKRFVKDANEEMKDLMVKANRASWVQETYITDDTEALATDAAADLNAFTTRLMKDARAYDKAKVDADTRRHLHLFKISNDPGPSGKIEELSAIEAKMSSLYGKKEICDEWSKKNRFDQDKDGCLSLDELEVLMGEERNADDLLHAWKGWHRLGPELRPYYKDFVTLSNQGAREANFKDMGEIWRSRYDMPAAAFEGEMERLWTQLEPLYKDLHCYVKDSLGKLYPDSGRADGKIPAHLLGNMWAQEWNNLYDALEPYPGESRLDVTKALKDKGYDVPKMVKLGESFFTSMGFAPLPETFWQRSMLTKPRDRDVVCHASAWDVSTENDLRIKMCTQINEENLITIHHELGHIFYYQSYYQLPVNYQQGAHDGFHEAIGDAIALSVNPNYLAEVGLMPAAAKNSEKALINLQMKSALTKVSFLPFAYLMDKWRWSVFSGKTTETNYNAEWWRLRGHYQGVAAPETRGEEFFDPAAKYHIPANVPYARYFLATVLQFQMFKAMCDASGYKGDLPNCSLYGQKEAGARLKKLLSVGASRPWQETLKDFAGTASMDAEPMLQYYAPLQKWLKEKNRNKNCAWQ